MSVINPFNRGHSAFQITRQVMIDYGSEFPLAYRPLHSSQDHLLDHYVESKACIFNDDHAYALHDGNCASSFLEDCNSSGQIRSVTWVVQAQRSGQLVHVGDFNTRYEANELVKALSFQNGYFSRCWEISNSHVTEEAYSFLMEKSGQELPFIEAFVLGDTSVGVKLICTPWTDDNLQATIGYESASALKKELVRYDVPGSLIDLLFLAAVADTRILILDSDASPMEGLPVYDW